MIKPLGERIIVKVVEKENKTESGLIIPDSLKDNSNVQEAEVIAVPDGDVEDVLSYVNSTGLPTKIGTRIKIGTDIYLKVSVSQKVLIPNDLGIEYKIDNIKHIILRQSDIIAIL